MVDIVRKIYKQNNKSGKVYYVRLPSEWVEKRLSENNNSYLILTVGEKLIEIRGFNAV